jgi:hypothetical protein
MQIRSVRVVFKLSGIPALGDSSSRGFKLSGIPALGDSCSLRARIHVGERPSAQHVILRLADRAIWLVLSSVEEKAWSRAREVPTCTGRRRLKRDGVWQAA